MSVIKKYNTQSRLQQIMNERNLRQVDILNLTKPYCDKYNVKFNKSDLSQYVSGKTEPNQDKLAILGMALNVSEAWLMGYEVPMERNANKIASAKITLYNISDILENLTSLEADHLIDFHGLPDEWKQKVDAYTKDALHAVKMEKLLYAAHQRTDMDVTDEMRKHDDNIMDDENF